MWQKIALNKKCASIFCSYSEENKWAKILHQLRMRNDKSLKRTDGRIEERTKKRQNTSLRIHYCKSFSQLLLCILGIVMEGAGFGSSRSVRIVIMSTYCVTNEVMTCHSFRTDLDPNIYPIPLYQSPGYSAQSSRGNNDTNEKKFRDCIEVSGKKATKKI